MVTSVSPIAQRKSGRFSRMAGIAIVIALLGMVVWQTGMVDRLPDEYVPDYIQRHLGQPAHPASAMISSAYLYQQQRPLSCEYASTTMASTMAGWSITEYDFDAVVPLSDNPHYGYRGNIWGEWGNTDDYGVYAEPLHLALSGWGIPSEVIYAEGDANVLKQELAAGRPVVVWLAMRGTANSFDMQGADTVSFQLTQYMHVMTAYGFDDSSVFLSDPGSAAWRQYGWDEFMGMWNVMDGMALSVYPNTSALRPIVAEPTEQSLFIERRLGLAVLQITPIHTRT